MTQSGDRNDYELYQSGVLQRSSTAHAHKSGNVHNDEKLRIRSPLILFVVRMTVTTLNYDPINCYAVAIRPRRCKNTGYTDYIRHRATERNDRNS